MLPAKKQQTPRHQRNKTQRRRRGIVVEIRFLKIISSVGATSVASVCDRRTRSALTQRRYKRDAVPTGLGLTDFKVYANGGKRFVLVNQTFGSVSLSKIKFVNEVEMPLGWVVTGIAIIAAVVLEIFAD